MRTKVVHHPYHKMESFVFQKKIRSDRVYSTTVSQPQTSAPTSISAAVIDRAAAKNMLKPTNTIKTFQGYANQVFLPYIKGQLQHVQRVDIAWDEYVLNSLKATTREKRGRGIRRRVSRVSRWL